MIINSKFKDYYDPIAHQYRDEKVVYNRKTKKIPWSRKDKEWTKNEHQELKKIQTEWTSLNWHKKNSENDLSYGCVLFCGKLFPFTELGWIATTPYDTSFPNRNFKTPYEDMVEDDNRHKRTSYVWRHTLAEKFDVLKNYNGKGMLNFTAKKIHEDYDAPIIWITGNRIILNPRLDKSHFPLSGWEIVQELMMFLQSKQPYIPEISDKDLAEAKGFDNMSFKREKGGPTRKRKKLSDK